MNEKEIEVVQALVNAADKIAEERDELLAALKALVAEMEKYGDTDWYDEVNGLQLITNARAAIAKAEGK